GESIRVSWDDREDIFTTTVLSVIRDLGLNTEGIHYQMACQIRTSMILSLPSQKTVERTELQSALQTMIRRKMLKEGTIKKLTQRKTGETPHEEMSWVNAQCISEDEIIASIDTASYEALDIPAENKRSIVVQCVRATLQKHGFELRKVTFADLKHAIAEYLRNPSSMESQPPDYRTALDSQGQRTPRQKTGSAKTFS
ncbi:hypothetical protein HZA87_02415, partial [Candidatus Uhrbacteria bacterium]|nr:hypothetical protein [Candidatus Uhrbacteria bacterium]